MDLYEKRNEEHEIILYRSNLIFKRQHLQSQVDFYKESALVGDFITRKISAHILETIAIGFFVGLFLSVFTVLVINFLNPHSKEDQS